VQGSRYKPPQDKPPLVEQLRHTLDFLGLPAPHFPSSGHSPVLLLPAYAANPGVDNPSGMLLNSASAHGWANANQSRDPIPDHVWPEAGEQPERRWLAAVVSSEHTNAGECNCSLWLLHSQ
jgi:hypothetical protein